MTDTAFPPAGATDCHTHVAIPDGRYPMVSPRAYTPGVASAEDAMEMLRRLGLDRIVLVQMSVFGTDNTCMIDEMAKLGDRCRGVAQVAADCPGTELDRLDRLGITGIRVNLNTTGLNDPALARERLKITARQCARNGWHLQLFTSPEVIATLSEDLSNLPVPVILDHFGLLSPIERDTPAERVVRGLLSSGKGWVKISGTYRLSSPDAADAIAGLARDLVAENPDNIVWGSDWPHSPHHAGIAVKAPEPQPYRDLDPGALLDTIRQWFPEEPLRWRQILTDNPARLYHF
jgi:predicted TIM-barrel fold metal-dependent hydrolase